MKVKLERKKCSEEYEMNLVNSEMKVKQANALRWGCSPSAVHVT